MAEENAVRIAIVGPESSGKSTLAMALAKHYELAYVPEVARDYFRHHEHANYTIKDVIAIAQWQQELEDQMAAKHQKVICDTSALVSKIWAEVRFAHCPAEIQQLDSRSNYTHTLLCAPDLPWQADPLRENPHNRAVLFGIYTQHLNAKSIPYSIITGEGNERISAAIKAINPYV